MSLNFARIKEIRIVDVVGRYGISLTTKGAWANGVCKLPTHKANNNGKNFSVNVAGNFWRCFSQSCNEANGGKRGGDVISFVALMENCSPKDAAQKLSDCYHLEPQTTNAQNKTASHIEKPSSAPQRKHNIRRTLRTIALQARASSTWPVWSSGSTP